jgi:hypothetical protein
MKHADPMKIRRAALFLLVGGITLGLSSCSLVNTAGRTVNSLGRTVTNLF